MSSDPEISDAENILSTIEPGAPALPKMSVSRGGQWLHPMSIIFDALSNGRRNLFPAIVALTGAAQGGTWGRWGITFAIVIFGASLLASVFRYVTLRYQIANGELTVRSGLFFKRVRTVPLSRIQNIDSTQNVLHRALRVAEVSVETASGKEPEAKLRVLSLDKNRSTTRNDFSGTVSFCCWA